MENKLSIIIPCLNEADHIEKTLAPLQALRQRGHEIIVSDGGSIDDTQLLASNLCDLVTQSAKGRSRQLNHGASLASGDVLCFLHADTIAPDNLDTIIFDTLKKDHAFWGRFNVKLSGEHFLFRIIENMMNWRSYLTGVATGDQGIFIYQSTFNKINGFKDIPLMEDIEISKRLRSFSFPACIKQHPLITSSRRWETHGILNTVILMWQLRLQYFLGVSPEILATKYRNHG